MIQFKKREIIVIFVMFVAVTTLVFSMGIYMGGIFVSHEFKSATNVETTDVVIPNAKREESPREIPPLRSAQGRDDSETSAQGRDDSPSQAPELRGCTIQVSAVEDHQIALTEAERLKGLGFPTVFIEEALMENRKWFFVNLGYFQNEKKAFALASRLQKKGILSSFLIRKSESQIHEEN